MVTTSETAVANQEVDENAGAGGEDDVAAGDG